MAKDLAYYMSLSYPSELSREAGEDGYFATHPDLPGCMAEGETADEAIENLDAARELWIETRLENGHSVPEPIGDDYSGRISLRIPVSLHGQLARLARREGMSLNATINNALALHVGAANVFVARTQEVAEIKMLLTEGFRRAGSPPTAYSTEAGFHGFAGIMESGRFPIGTAGLGEGDEGWTIA